MIRFVVLFHDFPEGANGGAHWDWMFEVGSVLKTWRSEIGVVDWRAIRPIVFPVSQIADHRLAYLDFEGPISGQRGEVVRVQYGELSLAEFNESTELWSFKCRVNDRCFKIEASQTKFQIELPIR
ncbi:MAG: hypothetical protein R3C03_02300 [Pirellulaceae bacterium]